MRAEGAAIAAQHGQAGQCSAESCQGYACHCLQSSRRGGCNSYCSGRGAAAIVTIFVGWEDCRLGLRLGCRNANAGVGAAAGDGAGGW